jgi:hypothetical protein
MNDADLRKSVHPLACLVSARQDCATAAPSITDQGETEWKTSLTKSPQSYQSLQLRS